MYSGVPDLRAPWNRPQCYRSYPRLGIIRYTSTRYIEREYYMLVNHIAGFSIGVARHDKPI